MGRLAVLVIAALALLVVRAEAQRPDPWFFRPLVYPTYDFDEGLMAHVSIGWRHGPNRRPPAVSKALSLDMRFATSGTRGVYITYDVPGYWKNWRLLAQAGTERLQRVPFYGGNNSQIADSLTRRYYRYSLLRTTALAEVQRQLAGPLRLHAAAQWRHYHARPLSDSTSAFAAYLASGGAKDSVPLDVVELRGALLFDTRDFENTPSRGVFLEAMAVHAISDRSYDRYLLSAREFAPIGEYQEWVIAFRQTAELSGGDVPLSVQYERLTTWYPDDGFGGATSLRLFAPGRFLAPNRAVFSLDARRKILDAPFPTSPYRVWVLGFMDAGRLWERGETPSLSHLHWTVGVGARLQFGKSSLFGLDIGRTDEAFGFNVGTAFAF